MGGALGSGGSGAAFLLVLQHLWVLNDGVGELLRAGDGQALTIDVLVDGVLMEEKREGESEREQEKAEL